MYGEVLLEVFGSRKSRQDSSRVWKSDQKVKIRGQVQNKCIRFADTLPHLRQQPWAMELTLENLVGV